MRGTRVANYRIQNDGLLRLLTLALNEDGDAIVQEWKDNLSRGIVNDEMRAVFAARGWISSERDARLQREDDMSDIKGDPENDNLREVASAPRRGRNKRGEGEDEDATEVREAPSGSEEVDLRES